MPGDSDERPSVEEKHTEDSIRISPEVIAVVAGIAVEETEGVAGMSGGIVDGIAQRLGRKDFGKGIRVSL